MTKKNIRQCDGFTVIELVVSVAIFAFMTMLLLAKYGSFNDGVIMTNLAYDSALIIRNAQSYGLNVKSAPTGGSNYSNEFNLAYGVHFDISSVGNPAPNKKVVFFADLNSDRKYTSGEAISTYSINRGNKVYSICGGPSSCVTNMSSVDITFKRPSPDAIVFATDFLGNDIASGVRYLIVTFQSPNNTLKKLRLNSAGQISITD